MKNLFFNDQRDIMDKSTLIFNKNARSGNIYLIWLFSIFIVTLPHLAGAETQLVKSMKTTMYEYVADDEEIEFVEKWINNGAKNNAFFKEEILTIMEYDCQNCHSTTSTMSEAAPDIPLTSYEEVVKFTKAAQSDEQCLACHAAPELLNTKHADLQSKFIDQDKRNNSVHKELPCTKCHLETHAEEDLNCQDKETFQKFLTSESVSNGSACKEIKNVDCATCHKDQKEVYQNSVHFNKLPDIDQNAANCYDCHNKHDVKKSTDLNSAVHITKVSETCGECHQGGSEKDSHKNILADYQASQHGIALVKKGLTKSAPSCVTCHDSHNVLPVTDEKSLVHRSNLTKTCSDCHIGINEQLQTSVHSSEITLTDKKLPVCNDCHESHRLVDTNLDESKFKIVSNCGDCHEDLLDSYYDTYHGKVEKLGGGESAKCFDCHGTHNILSKTDTASLIHSDNIQATCAQCHDDINENFTDYIPHADAMDKENYPQLYYTVVGMTFLLIVTFMAFGFHTLLWFIRSLIDRTKNKGEKHEIDPQEKHVKRFTGLQIILHLMIVVSFLSLALTGMSLKFADNAFFSSITHLFGGPAVMGIIHRIGAIITFAYAAIHLSQLALLFKKKKITIKGLFTEEYSLVPTLKDARELKANFLYFIGKRPKPEFGRWTYWEKFDYMAVFWGVTVIGFSGLALWFPEIATKFLPGWTINVASIIHSDEALLAAGFIFTIHFFHTHLRPESFPMDSVIFTQRLPLSKFKEERRKEYDQMVAKGELEKYLVDPPSKTYMRVVYVAGVSFLAIGLSIVVSIIYSLIAAI
jgi:cytochrome b subunit of formate dehydrogenase